MAGGKVTVRQKMINMMYLVLTALLALNVSAEILKSFHMVEVSMDSAGRNIDEKNNDILRGIAKFHTDVPNDAKGTDAYNKSLEVKKVAEEGIQYFKDLKDKLITNAGGRKVTDEHPDGDPNEEVAQPSNIELHANLMINQGEGAKVKAKINEIREKILAILPADKRAQVKSDLFAEDPKNSSHTWESEMFEHTPLAAVIALMAKTQNDIKNTEAQALDILKGSLLDNVKIVTDFEAQIIPTNGTFITQGNKYEADIFLAASSSRSEAEITVNGTRVESQKGIGKYSITATREGENKYKAVITAADASGKSEKYEKEGSFFVMAPLAVISATAMNVVYIGLANPFSVSVPGVSGSELEVKCNGGNLKKIDNSGKYEITVDGSVRTITVSVGVKGRIMGTKEYRVRQIPKPTPMLGTIEQSGSVSPALLRIATYVATPLKDFVFEGVKFVPVSSTLIYQPRNGQPKVFDIKGANLDATAQSALKNCRPGDRFTLMKIRAKGPAGDVNLPTALALEVN